MTYLFQKLVRAHLVILLLVFTLPGAANAGESLGSFCDTPQGIDDRFGTQIDWVENILEARREVWNSHKLLMVMQISGDFTKPTFT